MKRHALYPLLFTPVYKSMLWGGTRIALDYNRSGTPAPCAESWEVSTQPDGLSVIANGAFMGHTLAELVQTFGTELVGTRAPDPHAFPLLFKLIDAAAPLSIQVHPNETTAPITGGDPKTEMWYVLNATPDAELAAGVQAGTTPEAFRAALEAGHAEDLIPRVPAKAGEAFFIPGGLIHSIGAGYLIYEVQQTSNTTYRLSDWGRSDPKTGKPRELHVEKSFQSIDWSLPPPAVITAPTHSHDLQILCRNPFFTFGVLSLMRSRTLSTTSESFMVLFCAKGKVALHTDSGELTLRTGTSVLLPAKTHYVLTPIGKSHTATMLLTTL